MSKSGAMLSEQVYEQLLQMILNQEILCGEKIPEDKIAQKFGISRTPIREALRKLANEGIVRIIPKCFAEVVTFDEQGIKDLGIMRMTLDTLAVRLAILYGSNADFLKLKNIADLCYQASVGGEVIKRIQLDCDFHMALAEIARNPLLLKFQRELYLKVALLQKIKYTTIEDDINKIQGHFAIVDGLISRDEEEVVRSLQKHLGIFYGMDFSSSLPDGRVDL
jgi:DNA-binding GntR family transcriptional regulator